MAVDKVAPSKFTPQVNTGTDGSPTWVPIKGINSIDPDPSAESVDATDYDSPSWSQDRIVSRGKTFTLSGFYMVDTALASRDPGQAAVEASDGTVAGDALNIRQYRIVKSWGGAITFHATANVKGGGGGAKALSPWQVTLSCTDKPVET